MSNSTADAIADEVLRSRSASVGDRIRSAAALGQFITNEAAFQRLVEMLDDENIAVEVDAAEVLVRQGGRRGLQSVLEVLGRRTDDPDVDYIAYKLEELQGSREAPVLSLARSIRNDGASPYIEFGVESIERLFGHLPD